MPAEASRSIAEEIAEKRRIAQEKLKARQNQSITSGNLPPSTSSTPQIGKFHCKNSCKKFRMTFKYRVFF